MRAVLGSVRRPDVWLPAAGLVVASALVLLAAAAARALEERHAVALEGRALRLAQEVEFELREVGPKAAEEVLRRQLTAATGLAVGLALADFGGRIEVEAGELPAAGMRDVELHLGRVWHQEGQGSGSGQRLLRIAIDPAILGPTASEHLLLPVTVFSGIVLAALSALGGRLLMRQQRQQQSVAQKRRLEGIARAGAGLAHQIRTPLATIKGSCQLLLESAGEAGDERLQAVVAQAERMEAMLRKLLDYARPPQAEPADVDLEAATKELVALDARRLRLRVDAGLRARVDREHLREILDNLVDNALRASEISPAGSVRDDSVDVAAEMRGRWVEISIGDRGPGPGDDSEILFEPYLTRRAGGTGLGLPIARSLAEANGGRLELAARPGGGTRAVLRLPPAGTPR